MQVCHQPGEILEAPSPNIPTYRPSSESFKRSYTMSALAPKYQQYLSMADDIHSPDTVSTRPNPENVTEIVRLLQTHVSSAPSAGPKDMIRAGHRRLKLAFSNRRGAETKDKTVNAPQQKAALQHQGPIPRSHYQKWEHKRSVPSTDSNSEPASDLSSKSNSKRDVESIGRPWLDHPLESRDEPGSKGSSAVSSLDLRDLASFVEAAVNFSQTEDSDAPPYQPLRPAAAGAYTTEQSVKVNSQPRSTTKVPAPHTKAASHKSNDDLPIASRFKQSAWRSNDNLKNGCNPSEGLTCKDNSATAAQHFSRSSTGCNGPRATAMPALKLFPDTIPSRTPSQKALRIPAGRSPTPNQFTLLVPGSQSTPALSAAFDPSSHEDRSSSGSLPKIQENAPDLGGAISSSSAKLGQTRAESSLNSKRRQVQDKRRPSSLPPTAIDSFSVPAPVKPLPSVPEPESRAFESPVDQKSDMTPPNISVSSPSSSGSDSSTSRGRDSPFPRLLGSEDLTATHNPTAGPPIPIQPRHGSLGKTERSREAKVRSLIIRDIAKSRYKRSPTRDRILEEQLSPPHRIGADSRISSRQKHDDSQSCTERKHRKKASSAPSSSLTPSPLESRPRLQRQSQRYCSSPVGAMAALTESYESPSHPASNTNLHANWKNQRHAETKPERKSTEQTPSTEAEAPLPSSDEEGPDGNFYRSAPIKPSRRRRRAKPAPLVIEKSDPERGRSSKSHPATSSLGHPAQRSYKKRALEKTPRMHLTPDYQTQNYLTPEPRLNPSLEGRVEHLERQNRILQAALFAALDVGVKQDLSSLLGASPAPASTDTPPLTGTSFSTEISVSDSSSIGPEYHSRGRKPRYGSESWIASPRSLSNDSYDSDAGAEVKKLEQMVDEFDLGWLSDQSSIV
ncbi:hypothetical protein BDV18DRAFT_139868, partial [Aspergillus unguis]